MRRSEAELEANSRMILDLSLTVVVLATDHEQVTRITREVGLRVALLFLHPGLSARELNRCRTASSPHPLVQHVAPAGNRARPHYMNIGLRTARTPWVLLLEQDASLPTEWLAQLRIALHRWPQALQANVARPDDLLAILVNRRLVFELGWFDETLLVPPYDMEDWRLRMSQWIGVDLDRVQKDRYCDIPSPLCTIPLVDRRVFRPGAGDTALHAVTDRIFWSKWKVDHATGFVICKLHKSGKLVRVRLQRATDDYYPLDRQNYGGIDFGR